ncbi:hypothetical protein BGX27_007173 [Mortierella sp. AM989]|nr:hypothetical protein BGX27_007173 [Mortierella sp. AM989]
MEKKSTIQREIPIPTQPVHALTLPEILLRIARYLDLVDIQACSIVSRPLYKSFTPFLWQDLHFGSPCRLNPDLEPFARSLTINKTSEYLEGQNITRSNQEIFEAVRMKVPWIRSLTVHDHNSVFPLRLARHCTQLSSITMEGLSLDNGGHTTEHWTSCKKIFKKSRSCLQTVSLNNWGYNEYERPVRGQMIWNPILNCVKAQNLCSLSLESCSIRKEHSKAFWTICKQLEKLNIYAVRVDLDVPNSPPQGQLYRWIAPPKPASKPACPRFPRMKDLRCIGLHSASVEDQLEHILRQCPNIHTLYWSLFGNEYEILEEFCNVYADSTWPSLDYIVVMKDIRDRDFAKLLQYAKQPLRHVGYWPYMMQPETFDILRQRHFQTIEKIDLQHTEKGNRQWAIEILTSCPSLESFKASHITAQEIFEAGPWVCTGLRQLVIFIDMGFGSDALCRRFTPEEIQQCRAVYSQLSALKGLRKLDMLSTYAQALGHTNSLARVLSNGRQHLPVPLPLNLKAGLDQLAKLTNLEEISFWSGGQAIRMRELLWMVNHWKRLKNIAGGWYVSAEPATDDQDKYLKNGELKKWLLEQGICTKGCLYVQYNAESEERAFHEDCCGLSDNEGD